MSAPSSTGTKPPHILFVCMGNICRSPAADGVMRHYLKKAEAEGLAEIDSAGTIGYHAGNLPDHRMTKAASLRGIPLTHRARQVRAEDLSDFDLIFVMDRENLVDVRRLDPEGKHRDKVHLFCKLCAHHDDTFVPDPYYGGAEGFEHVLDLLEDGCSELLKHLREGTWKSIR